MEARRTQITLGAQFEQYQLTTDSKASHLSMTSESYNKEINFTD
jgi:hypothetical protein